MIDLTMLIWRTIVGMRGLEKFWLEKPLTVQSLIRYCCGSLKEKDVEISVDSQSLACEVSENTFYQGHSCGIF